MTTAQPTLPMLELLSGFIQELREAGLPVSLTENLDAMEAVQHIPIEDREAFKYALAATLVKNNAHWRAFETLFEVYFSLRGKEYALDPDQLDELLEQLEDGETPEMPGAGQDGAGGSQMSPEELAEMLYQSLMKGDQGMMRAVARQSVKRFAGMEPGRPVGGTYYLYRTLRKLDLDVGHGPADAAGARGCPRGPVAARGTAREGRVRAPHRRAEEGDRGRDPSPPGRRPGCRGHGQDAAQAAARGRRLHARLA